MSRYISWRNGRVVTSDLARSPQSTHSSGSKLDIPLARTATFRDRPHGMVVLDNNGIHTLKVDFCGCIGSPSVLDQLMNIGWFPATVKDLETCATIGLLHRFHTLNLQGRVPAYDFYNALEVLSDRAGLKDVPDRREQFMLMTREYQYLQMCKHAGRGHDGIGVPRSAGSAELVYGIDATKRGELAIQCQACPHPGINLPEGWEKAPPEKLWIYQLILSEDANFKMKGCATLTREKDPTLGPGFAYMVTNDEYLEHLSKYVDQDEISHCIAFAALWRANNKHAKGLRATGIGSRGKRYSNMDFLWFSTLMGITLLSIIASYDIACQWFCNFWERMKALPKEMHLPAGVKVQFKVLKFHLPPHVKKCHAPFSFNFTKWVGRTDGEGVERNWSWLNMIVRSVSVMGPGLREDTIDNFCGFANWRKTGNSLLCKMVLAIPNALLHNWAFNAFTDGLREGHEEELMLWEVEVRAWEQDHDQQCPLVWDTDGAQEEPTMEEVRLKITEEEHGAGGEGVMVRLEAMRRNRTSTQVADLQCKQTLLLGWLCSLRRESTRRPEEMLLHLPSSFPKEVRNQICVADLPTEEECLCLVQAHKVLRDLRWHLRIWMLAHRFKWKNLDGQAAYTKSQALSSDIEKRIKGASNRYRAAREALVGLQGDGPWQDVLKELRQQDVRGMNERTLNDEEKEEERKARILAGLPPDEDEVDEFGDVVEPTVLFNLETGEGTCTLSWIWYTGAAVDAMNDRKLHDNICVEWMKACARADRWREELVFLEEEMRRVLEFCYWKARWWDERHEACTGVSAELAEGLRAYAMEQAARKRAWAAKWELKWAAAWSRAMMVLRDDLVDVTDVVAVEVELEEEVAYGGI
ncbi:CxC2 domain-containing protein [Mycena venus]|uniref:CxC2 domain-containing protein n=1 Tax=Mycena venus TaxID=2733690 RepID=A0A8H6YLE0_9AGAR|nr:CxC2 domain-containing protein [Mycena venus]